MSSSFAEPAPVNSPSSQQRETGTCGASPRRRWSLTIWLTCFSSLASFLVLALISALLYGGLAVKLDEQNRFFLHDEADIIEGMLRSRTGEDSLLAELNKDNTGREYVKHYIRLMDRTGRVIMQTASMERALPPGALPIPLRDGRPAVDRRWHADDGRIFLVTSNWVGLDAIQRNYGILEIALDITNVETILVNYRRNIYTLLGLGLLICVALSYAVVRRGMRPLREVTDIVRNISASSLEKRVVGNDWPGEVLSLASALNLMLDRLQDYFDRLYKSAINLSHKMRTPLTIMKGEAEVALSRERTVQELEDVIASGLEENTRLVRLVDNILFLSDAEIGKFCCSPRALDAGAELEKVLDFYAPLAEEQGITIECRGNANLLADASLFRKAAAALISNAVTYNDPGGTVTLRLLQGDGLSGQLSVMDTGCGIPEEEKPKVFDRFYRIYGSRHRDPHGTGLGLPIVKVIMDLHQGSVALDSAPGEGTAVTLTFPAAR